MTGTFRDQTKRPACPNCVSRYVVKEQRTSFGQRYKCKMCGASFYGNEPKKARASGSGIIAVPRRPDNGAMRELKRDMFAHWRLCEVTRK